MSHSDLYNTVSMKRDHESHRACTGAANRETGILRLPAEIRNQIYDLVFTTGDVVHISHARRYLMRPCPRCDWREDLGDSYKQCFSKIDGAPSAPFRPISLDSSTSHAHITDLASPQRPISCIGLLETCRQLRTEALRFYYGYKFFVLSLDPVSMPRTRTWILSRPAEFFAVTKKVYFSQEMRRCSSRSLGTKERLHAIDIQTLDVEIVPVRHLHHGCLKRYVEHVQRKERKEEYRTFKAAWVMHTLSQQVTAESMVELAEIMQHNRKSSDEVKAEKIGWEEMAYPSED